MKDENPLLMSRKNTKPVIVFVLVFFSKEAEIKSSFETDCHQTTKDRRKSATELNPHEMRFEKRKEMRFKMI